MSNDKAKEDNNEYSVIWSSPSKPPPLEMPISLDSNASQTPHKPDSLRTDTLNREVHYDAASGFLGKFSSLVPSSSPPQVAHDLGKRKNVPSPVKLKPSKEPLIKRRANKPESPLKPKASPLASQLSFPEPEFSSDEEWGLPPVKYVPSYYTNKLVRRFVVQQIELQNDDFVLVCINSQNEKCEVVLTGSWRSTIVSTSDIIHLVSFKESNELVLTDENELYLVVNPDILVTCTSVAQHLVCERQLVLSTRVRTPLDLNVNMVLGSIKHELIQSGFEQNCIRDQTQLTTILQNVVNNYTIDLKLVDLEPQDAINKLEYLIPKLVAWATELWGKDTKGKEVPVHIGKAVKKLRVNKPIYIEEEIRSPLWGLHGKIDVTTDSRDLNDTSIGERLVAMEMKTGSANLRHEHSAQAMLYILLLAERHPNNTHPWSILYYSESGGTFIVEKSSSEIRQLVMARNSVAFSIWKETTKLPIPYSTTDSICKWCARRSSCALYTAIEEKGQTFGIPALAEVYNQALSTGNFTSKFLEFINHWHKLLNLEFDVAHQYDQLKQRQYWVNNLNPQMWKAVHFEELNNQVICTLNPVGDGVQCEFSNNDYIVISTPQHLGVANSRCLTFTSTEIKLVMREKLLRSAKYRLDLDPYSLNPSLALAKYNLDSLLEEDRLRELVVELLPPKFHDLQSKQLQTTADRASNKVLTDTQKPPTQPTLVPPKQEKHMNLNEDQVDALNKVLGAKDYALILGMPGTGKTTTIAAIVSALIDKKQTVLLSAYTNSAVDTIAMKLMSANIPCVRLANSSMDSVHPQVLPITLSIKNNEYDESVINFLDSPVVLCTSHSANNKFFSLRKFDTCILDEASQITLPYCLGPLRLASKFVLVGDHYQLPPLVRNPVAKREGLDQSLFKLLGEAHPEAMVELRKQYRMCEDIMRLSSDLIYDGRMVCGSESVANQQLSLPKFSDVQCHKELIDPNQKVVFVNTDGFCTDSYEVEHELGVSNPFEESLIKSLVDQFDLAGADLQELAVISVYRQQLEHISESLTSFKPRGLEILTADQAQGRDKGCIIVSLVRSNSDLQTGELLKDWRRLNVAFTRAKKKLIIIGSGRMMQAAEGVAKYYTYAHTKGWVHAPQKI